jgi:hypothetical protein
VGPSKLGPAGGGEDRRNGDYSHPNFASAQNLDAIDAELTEAGVEHEVFQPTDGRPTAEAILAPPSRTRPTWWSSGCVAGHQWAAWSPAARRSTCPLEAQCPVLTVKVAEGSASSR